MPPWSRADHRKRWRIWATRTQHGGALCGHDGPRSSVTPAWRTGYHLPWTRTQEARGSRGRPQRTLAWSRPVGHHGRPVRDPGADQVCNVKESPNPLHDRREASLGHAGSQDFEGGPHDCAETVDQDSGRRETRRYEVMGASAYSPYVDPTPAGADLQGRVRVVSASRGPSGAAWSLASRDQKQLPPWAGPTSASSPPGLRGVVPSQGRSCCRTIKMQSLRAKVDFVSFQGRLVIMLAPFSKTAGCASTTNKVHPDGALCSGCVLSCSIRPAPKPGVMLK